MRETHYKPLQPKSTFFWHLTWSIFFGLIAISLTLYIGMLGYHAFEKMPWVDAFANAAMILSGMGPLAPLKTSAGKIFAGCYALFSGLSFVFIVGIIFSPVIRRFLHKFHLKISQ